MSRGKVADLIQEQRTPISRLEQSAPVTVGSGERPLAVPKNSDLARSPVMVPQSTGTKGLFLRWLCSCSSRAICSFPVPEAPRMSTEMSERATSPTNRYISRALALSPR